jgi:glycosyltransferase involved in cell wall biosynthesis
LPEQCIKIVHLDTAHWIFNNSAAYRRHYELKERRNVVLSSFKWVEPNWAIEYADYATTNWGNQFNVSTYKYSGKPIFQIPLPTCAIYPEPDKNFSTCKNHFVWFGSDGLVHKGLDLVLEAFATMPECQLTVCGPLREKGSKAYKGPLQRDEQFEAAFHLELYECENIYTAGWIDVESEDFYRITRTCIGVVFPSCSEGGGASAITCMQAGLIPIVSYETNVNVGDFGYTLRDSSIEEVKKTVRMVSALPIDDLKEKAYAAWRFCQDHHTRKQFIENYCKVIENIMTERRFG